MEVGRSLAEVGWEVGREGRCEKREGRSSLTKSDGECSVREKYSHSDGVFHLLPSLHGVIYNTVLQHSSMATHSLPSTHTALPSAAARATRRRTDCRPSPDSNPRPRRRDGAPQPLRQDSQHEEPPQRASSTRTKCREIKAKEVGRRPARRKSARRPLKQIRADACNLLSGDLLYRAVDAMQREAERAQPANLEDQQRLKKAAKTIRKLNLEQARIRKMLNRQNPRRQPDGEATGSEV